MPINAKNAALLRVMVEIISLPQATVARGDTLAIAHRLLS